MSAADNQERVSSISRWLDECGLASRSIDALTGDISLRRYFRVHLADGTSAIVAYYPVRLRPVCRRFRVTSMLLEDVGVAVPVVRAHDCRRGLMLIEDAGDRTLYDEPERDWNVLTPVYHCAADYIRRIHTLSRDTVAALNAPLDAALLAAELRKSWEIALVPRNLVGEPDVARAFAAALDALCTEIGAAERLVPCHRDFMPRNLKRRASRDGGSAEELLVLDHQDLRLGPAAYDLASLLNDSIFPPRELEDELVARLLPGDEGGLAYRRAVVQRTIKAVGSYCSFALRGFDRHLTLVAPTLARAWSWFATIPELAELRPALLPAWRTALDGLLD
jgi:N-acetylmuramate 1-kinase